MTELEREEYLAKQAAGVRYEVDDDGEWQGGLHYFCLEKERYRVAEEKVYS